MENKRFYVILAIIGTILLLPLIAMQFTTEVNWDVFDFIVAGILLVSTGIAIEIALRSFKTTKSRIAILAVLFLVLFIVWAELAVGIFGTPFAGS